jgi:hypothetical protein
MAATVAALLDGVKVTVKVVLPPGGTVVSIPVVSMLKAPAPVPFFVIASPVRSIEPGFLMVNTRGALLDPTATVPNPTADGALSRIRVPTGLSTSIKQLAPVLSKSFKQRSSVQVELPYRPSFRHSSFTYRDEVVGREIEVGSDTRLGLPPKLVPGPIRSNPLRAVHPASCQSGGADPLALWEEIRKCVVFPSLNIWKTLATSNVFTSPRSMTRTPVPEPPIAVQVAPECVFDLLLNNGLSVVGNSSQKVPLGAQTESHGVLRFNEAP